MSVTIRTLLDHWPGSLELIVPADRESQPSIDEPLMWVHSSELPDPTPFLDAGHLVLTDGTQFPTGSAAAQDYDEYVARLHGHGILGLGFGTALIHGGLPVELASACRRQGLPLFTITDLTPFLAIIRFVADALAEEQNARIRWSLDAQRAIARAAMRAGGLTAILTELEQQLRCTAALYDAVGVQIQPSPSVPNETDTAVRQAVRATLERGVRSASRLVHGDHEFMIQTIGPGKRLDGALVLSGFEGRNPAATDLVNSVIAMAGLALTQNRALDEARHHLRAGLFEQLIRGDHKLVERTASTVWGGLPGEPVTVIVADLPRHSDFLSDALERETEDHHGAVFYTRRDAHLVVLTESRFTEQLVQVLARHSIRVGISTGGSYEELSRGVSDAERALRHAVESGRPRVEFREFIDRGVLGLLRGNQVGSVARAVVGQLQSHDAEKGTDLLATVRVWLDHECAWDAAARELGIHRHTLRNRVQAAGRLLGLDLDLLRDRFELWAALQLRSED